MYNKEDLEKRIEKFNEYNDKIYEKNIPDNVLNIFHKVVIKISKERGFIIKGSRAAQAILPIKIYKNDMLKYADYDLLSKTPYDDLIRIGEELKKENVIAKVINIIFKIDIFRLSIFGVSLIDAEYVESKIFDKIPYINKEGTKYLDPEYWKIDLYSILCRPVYINVKNWKKTLNRIKLIEEYCPYKTDHKTSSLKDNIDMIENVLKDIEKLDKNILITGSYAYNKLIERINVPYLEILTIKYYELVNKVKNMMGKYGNIRIQYNKSYLYMMSYNTVIYVNNNPICIIYNVTMCTAYDEINGRKYTDKYYLKFYYNFMKYGGYNFADNKGYYDYLLSKIKIESIPKMICEGDVNPGVREYLDFMKKHKEKKIVKTF